MDSASLQSLTPVFDDIDRWFELAPLLPLLVFLEIILSADNAVALASISRRLKNIELQRKALNIGITISLILRVSLILAANYIIQFPLFKILASVYLLSLVFKNFSNNTDDTTTSSKNLEKPISLINVVFFLALTDLAFSIDSVTAAVAISDQILLVTIGAFIGVVALRFTSDLFIRWIEIYKHLENAGYLAVALVAIKLLLSVINPNYIIPEWVFIGLLVPLFFWGFSQKNIDN